MKHEKLVKSFYSYSVTFTALLFGTSAEQTILIEADSDFLLQELTYFSNIAQADQTDATRVIPMITLLITNTGSGRQFMDAVQPINNICGTGERPFILPQSKIFTARSSIQISAANFSGATNYNTTVSFIGTKLYKY